MLRNNPLLDYHSFMIEVVVHDLGHGIFTPDISPLVNCREKPASGPLRSMPGVERAALDRVWGAWKCRCAISWQDCPSRSGSCSCGCKRRSVNGGPRPPWRPHRRRRPRSSSSRSPTAAFRSVPQFAAPRTLGPMRSMRLVHGRSEVASAGEHLYRTASEPVPEPWEGWEPCGDALQHRLPIVTMRPRATLANLG
jgi:hypothetical protein